MSEVIEYFVPGVPFGKQRARMVRRGTRTITYTPQETVTYESQLTRGFLTSASHADLPLRGPIRVDICLVFPRTKALLSVNRKGDYKHGAGRLLMSVKPDEDNIRKCVLDSLTDYIEGGDSRVVGGTTLKVYAAVDEVSGTHIRITALSVVPGDLWGGTERR